MVIRDKLSSKSVDIVRGMAAKLEPAKKTIKNSHCLPDNEKNEALAANSQIPTSGEDLYLLLSFYDTYTFISIYKIY